MELALAERLCCPREHGTTPLVVRADQVQGRQLLAGVAGCPTCVVEWPLQADVVAFGPRASLAAATSPPAEALVAFLALTDPEARVWLDGVSADVVGALIAAAGPLALLADAEVPVPGALRIEGAPRVPFAAQSLDGAVLLRADRDAAMVDSVVRALRAGGRFVADDRIAVPGGIRELGRVATLWVGERVTAPTPVQLRRA
jgi:hypothetical protein